MTITKQPDPTCQQENVSPHIPMLIINQEGLIECITTAGRHLLGYRPEQRIKLHFLSHVHRRNMYRVVRDLDEMLLHGRQKASWLIRLYTGKKRWQWYKIAAKRRLQRSGEIGIAVTLTTL